MSATPGVFILGAVRTPIGKFCGMLRDASAVELGAQAVRGVLERARIPARHVQEIILGQVIQAGSGQNPARAAALKADLPSSVNAFTLNKCCGSGLKAVLLAAQAIKAGDADLLVAGGMESMSRAPYLLENLRDGWRLGNKTVRDSILADGLMCAVCNWHMGDAAEYIAKKFKVSRKDQDLFALQSHANALRAQAKGLFQREIVPVRISHNGKPLLLDKDEGPRADTNMKVLGRLPAVFRKKNGTVTAGNAPGLNDGASVLAVCSENYLRHRKGKPLARLLDYTAVGMDPAVIFTAPAMAALALLKKMKADWKDFDLIEANEAFAAQAKACEKIAGWDPCKVNVHGGAIALGHPLGASGARILTTLIFALREYKLRRGLATICMGGGNGLAAAIEIV